MSESEFFANFGSFTSEPEFMPIPRMTPSRYLHLMAREDFLKLTREEPNTPPRPTAVEQCSHPVMFQIGGTPVANGSVRDSTHEPCPLTSMLNALRAADKLAESRKLSQEKPPNSDNISHGLDNSKVDDSKNRLELPKSIVDNNQHGDKDLKQAGVKENASQFDDTDVFQMEL
ncbi:hypothetical protein QR680_000819 [Steinernema hermaphroditum]|uniref:Uncharacterized protein n=1 Tax=Steinernema hermaphroditum TaxID=289476 RepID=A0AA39GW00_9BILA|nr:hypothetical protein QR680_000819 [Steinernema hermaphroditum]